MAKVFYMWTKGMEPSKTNQTRWHNTFTPSLHLAILSTTDTTKLSYMDTGLFIPTKSTHQQGTQHCSLHSLLHTKWPISAMFSSVTDAPTCHADSVLLMYSTVQKWYILISPTVNLPTLILPTLILPTKRVLCHFAYSFLSNVLCGFQVFWKPGMGSTLPKTT